MTASPGIDKAAMQIALQAGRIEWRKHVLQRGSPNQEGTMTKRPDTERCALCGGARVQGKTTYSADLGFGVVVVRGVPAVVCEQCGEEWIANDTAQRLETITDQAKRNQHFVDVLPFQPQ